MNGCCGEQTLTRASPLLLPLQLSVSPPFGQLLLVTKDFQPQSGLLSATDLHALWRLVKEVPAVGFFNSGLEAGARCVFWLAWGSRV